MVSVQEEQNIIFTIAEETLTDEDYDHMIPLLQEKIRTFGMVRWYFEMRNFKGWTPGSMWRDLKFSFKNLENFEKVAMVGDKNWEKQLTQLMKPFTGAEVRFFENVQKNEAKDWIKKT